MVLEVFPVLLQSAAISRVEMRSWPCSILWAMAERWREQIERNHGAPLERIAARGGLTPQELWCAAREQSQFAGGISERDAAAWLATEILK